MRKCIVWIACMMLCEIVFAQTGVTFETLSFEKALEKAKAEKKLMFVDCYTVWCGPCKKMAKDILPTKEIGDLLNPVCVSIKCDMEKEGKALVGRYSITAYPTFLIIRPDGALQHKIVGSSDVKEFAQKLKQGLQEETSMSHYQYLYDTGKGTPKDMADYIHLLLKAHENKTAALVAEKLFSTLTDDERLAADNWFVYTSAPVLGDTRFNFMLQHVDTFKQGVGEAEVEVFIKMYYERMLKGYYESVEKGTLGDEAKVRSTLSEMYRGLIRYDVPGKSKFLFYVNWLEKCLDKNTTAIAAFLKDYFVEASNLWFVKPLYAVVKKSGSEADVESLVPFATVMEQVDREQQEYIQRIMGRK